MLSGCEEGDHDVLHFVYKENTQDIPKVLDAIKKHDYMECFGKPRLIFFAQVYPANCVTGCFSPLLGDPFVMSRSNCHFTVFLVIDFIL